MDDFLKNFYLYDDLTRINHPHYFHPHFHTPELHQIITNINNYHQYSYYFQVLAIYFYNLQQVHNKNAFVIVKWLIVTHQVIHLVKYGSIYTDIYESLSEIKIQHLVDPYEQYLLQKLVKPYKHYLQKLCLLKQKECLRDSIKARAVFQQETWFIKYNIVKLGISQFSASFKEFQNFFKECYPFLSKYKAYILSDLQRLFLELKKEYSRQEMELIRQEDMNELHHSIQLLSSSIPQLKTESFFITDQTAHKHQFAHFFQSGCKEENSLSLVLFPCS